MKYIESFEFTCYVLNGGGPRNPIISGTQYKEVYNHNQERSAMEIKRICERFIEFIEENKEYITDKKIFAYRY